MQNNKFIKENSGLRLYEFRAYNNNIIDKIDTVKQK